MKQFIVVIIFIATVFTGGGYLLGNERGEITTTIKAYEALAECAQGGDTATFAVEVDAEGRLSRYECVTGVRQSSLSPYRYVVESGAGSGPVFTTNTVAIASAKAD